MKNQFHYLCFRIGIITYIYYIYNPQEESLDYTTVPED